MERTTLRTRLRAALLTMSAGAVVLASTAFLTFDHISFRRAIAQRLESQATLLGGSSAVALSFTDPKLAGEILQVLSSQPQILSAAIYDRHGAVFARYVRPGEDPAELIPPAAGVDGPWSSGGHVGLSQPILDSGERVGMVFLRSDLSDAWRRLNLNIAVVSLILAGVLLATFIFTERVVKGITGPVAGLAETVRSVTSRRDYSIRARKEGPAELEILIDGVNDMLSQIQVRDGALQLARSELENRVEVRTAELRFLNAELSGEIQERCRIEDSLREKEQTLRTLVDYAPDAIVMLDAATGKFVDANRNAERLFGHDRATLLTLGPLDVSPAVQPDGRRSADLAAERMQEAVAGGLPAFEWTHRHADGRSVPCEIHLVRLPGAGRTRVRGSIMDISRRKEMDRLKDEFVSTVSHELRTPITSIQGSLGLVANGVLGALPAGARPMVEIAYKNCQRLVMLINDILDSEKIAAGQMKFDFQVQELMPLVEQAIEANRAYAAQFGVTYELCGGVPGAKVDVDAGRLLQVLTNLLSNAAKFSPAGGRVTVSVDSRGGAKLGIAVTDRGPGIPAEFRSRIFQKFSQADSSDTRQKGGTGLGLSISKAIVERHHGTIGFETELGKGSTFWVEIPEAVAARRPRVLHVEPDPEIRRLVAGTLGSAAETLEAPSLARARLLLLEEAVDFVVLNADLSDGSGLDLLALLDRPGVPRLPAVAFHGAGGPRPSADSFLKALAAHDGLPAALRALISPPADRLAGATAR